MSGGHFDQRFADQRFAIYFVPAADSALYRFGASVLGYDCYSGKDIDFISGANGGWRDKVKAARGYGFHATLKPPFRLRAGVEQADLEAALDRFAASRSPIEAGGLAVRAIGAFIALTLATSCPAVNELAADCVSFFDSVRAPMDEKERARRLTPNLTVRQRAHLDRWGYPYVFEDFRFHMTLSGPLDEADRDRALAWLRESFAAVDQAQHLTIDRLVIARQAGASFIIVRDVRLHKS
jgi:putative phosphonate metabolism protein